MVIYLVKGCIGITGSMELQYLW